MKIATDWIVLYDSGTVRSLEQPGTVRSLQHPCKIVKPEDRTLLSDEYWLQFAKELDRDRFNKFRFNQRNILYFLL